MCALGRAGMLPISRTNKSVNHYLKGSYLHICHYDDAWSVTPGAQVALREVTQLQDVRLSSVGH
jgi:hypothetical protein